jgi:hypothetical protein
MYCRQRMKNEYTILVEKLQGKRPLTRCRHKWEDILKGILNRTGGWELDLSASG